MYLRMSSILCPHPITFLSTYVFHDTKLPLTAFQWIMGLGAYYTAWKRQTRHFGHQKGDQYSCLVFDNRGMGKSDKPLCRYSTSEMARDLIDLLVHAGWLDTQDAAGQGQHLQRKIHVAGVSMGG